MLICRPTSGVSRISFRGGGGGSKFCLEKWGYWHGAKIFKNGAIWCVLESILLKFCQKNNLKVIFYIKITANVLLRTFFRGIAAYSPYFLSLVRFGVFWSTVSVNFLLRKYYNYLNNIDMALLRTSYLYGGFLEYYFRLQFSAFWSMHDKTSSSENANFKIYPSPKN